jgi:hypothetical protein
VKRRVRIDKDELDAAAGVEFAWEDVEYFVDVFSDYAGRHDRQRLPDYILERSRPEDTRRYELEARRAVVDAVEGVWRERRRRRGRGAHYDPEQEVHAGPLVRLVQYLLAAAGERPPSAATLYHDLKFLATNRERAR